MSIIDSTQGNICWEFIREIRLSVKETLSNTAIEFSCCIVKPSIKGRKNVRLRTKWLWVRVPLQSLKNKFRSHKEFTLIQRYGWSNCIPPKKQTFTRVLKCVPKHRAKKFINLWTQYSQFTWRRTLIRRCFSLFSLTDRAKLFYRCEFTSES